MAVSAFRPAIGRPAQLLAVLVLALGLTVGWARPAAADPGWDPSLPAVASAGAPGDALAIANASLAVTSQATSATMDLGRKFLKSLGFGGRDAEPTGVNPGRVRGPQAIEYVIRRGGSQLGMPYSWGGGKPTGPSTGVESGANIYGFDCSGLTQYSFAGVGVLIPKYSGDQYDAGRRVPLSQAKRGDLLFWGPGGSQHVAIYLGGGQMLEASGSAGRVRVSPVRTSGIQPNAVRVIES
ncbi:NlpC/P60 family peptidoglycan endopeptidase RipB [Mycolicibacterium fallax]|uniref:NlpC/P60 family peptidoglycan endopeptidase RipB n=1 Tax=Mycolicibacterium fallax TaxID=1793 RepID=UPI000A16895F|nr:NlpC/P60 family peptidoglycan endopeptidase RipB [Mycolicibacterium fallax]BBY97185.1 peptidase C40 [Mycolicibacterium fallax]